MKSPRLIFLILVAFALVIIMAKNGNRYFANYLLLIPALILGYMIRNEAATITPEEAERRKLAKEDSAGLAKPAPFPLARCILAFAIPCGICLAYFGPNYLYEKDFSTLALCCIIPSTTFLAAAWPDGEMTDGQKFLKKLRVGALVLFWAFALLLIGTICGVPMKNSC